MFKPQALSSQPSNQLMSIEPVLSLQTAPASLPLLLLLLLLGKTHLLTVVSLMNGELQALALDSSRQVPLQIKVSLVPGRIEHFPSHHSSLQVLLLLLVVTPGPLTGLTLLT